jgi:hypothetical protein
MLSDFSLLLTLLVPASEDPKDAKFSINFFILFLIVQDLNLALPVSIDADFSCTRRQLAGAVVCLSRTGGAIWLG